MFVIVHGNGTLLTRGGIWVSDITGAEIFFTHKEILLTLRILNGLNGIGYPCYGVNVSPQLNQKAARAAA